MFFPVILYPQNSSVIPYIWSDMRKINGVIIQGPQRQKMDMVYLNFEPFMQHFVSFIASSNQQIPGQIFDDIIMEWTLTLMNLEQMRLKALKKYLHSNDMEAQKNKVPIFKAIFNRDIDFFKSLTEEQKRLLSAKFTVTQLRGDKEEKLFVTNFLLEAIRNSFLPAVQYILSNYQESDLMPEGDMESLSLDPLSLSLVTYASLEPGHPLKEEARKIIKLLADHTDVNNTYNVPLRLNPISWSILLGLNDEVKFLLEQKNVVLIFNVLFHDWTVNLVDYANNSSSSQLGHYLQNKVGISDCEHFLQ